MGIFSRLFRKPEATFPVEALPLEVTVPTNSRPAVERHLRRIISLRKAAAEGDPRRDDLLAEADRRERQLALSGIAVPKDIGAVEKMLEDLTNGG